MCILDCYPITNLRIAVFCFVLYLRKNYTSDHLQILPCNSFHTNLFTGTILGDLEKLGQGQIGLGKFQLAISQQPLEIQTYD